MAKIFYFLGHEQFQPEVLIKHAQLAEQGGFDGVFISEHFNPWVADVGSAGFAFSTLGAIAATTQKLELMTGVVTPLFRYHPAVVAQAAATIDRISKGRFSLGVGTGESLNETALGYTFPGYKERSARMKEALEILEQLFAGEKTSYDGEFYKTKDAKLYSPPAHRVPIYLAAGGPKTALLAAGSADGLIVSVKDPQKQLTEFINPARDAAKKSGKPFAVVASRWSVYAQNNDEAWGALKAWRGLRAPNRDTATDPQQLQESADTVPQEEILSKYSIVKTPEEYIQTYKPLIAELSAEVVVIQTTSTNQESLIEMLGKEVVPALKIL